MVGPLVSKYTVVNYLNIIIINYLSTVRLTPGVPIPVTWLLALDRRKNCTPRHARHNQVATCWHIPVHPPQSIPHTCRNPHSNEYITLLLLRCAGANAEWCDPLRPSCPDPEEGTCHRAGRRPGPGLLACPGHRAPR